MVVRNRNPICTFSTRKHKISISTYMKRVINSTACYLILNINRKNKI